MKPPCEVVSGDGILPGWICCQTECKTYNGLWRFKCKRCQHARCALRPLTADEILVLWQYHEHSRKPDGR